MDEPWKLKRRYSRNWAGLHGVAYLGIFVLANVRLNQDFRFTVAQMNMYELTTRSYRNVANRAYTDNERSDTDKMIPMAGNFMDIVKLKNSLGCYGDEWADTIKFGGETEMKRVVEATNKTIWAVKAMAFADELTEKQTNVTTDPMSVCSCVDDMYYHWVNTSVSAIVKDKVLFPTAIAAEGTDYETNDDGEFKKLEGGANDMEAKARFANLVMWRGDGAGNTVEIDYCFGEPEPNTCQTKDKNGKGKDNAWAEKLVQTCVRSGVPVFTFEHKGAVESEEWIFEGQLFFVIHGLSAILRALIIDCPSDDEGKKFGWYRAMLILIPLPQFVLVWYSWIRIWNNVVPFDDGRWLAVNNYLTVMSGVVTVLGAVVSWGCAYMPWRGHKVADESMATKEKTTYCTSLSSFMFHVDTSVAQIIALQLYVDLPLIVGFVRVGLGIVTQAGNQEVVNVQMTTAIVLVVGLIAHLTNIVRRIENMISCEVDDTLLAELQSDKCDNYNLQKLKEITPGSFSNPEEEELVAGKNYYTSIARTAALKVSVVLESCRWYRITSCAVIVLAGLLIYMQTRESIISSSLLIEHGEFQLYLFCIFIVVVYAGYEGIWEATERFHEQYSEGTNWREFSLLLFLVIFNWNFMSYRNTAHAVHDMLYTTK